MDSWRFRLGMLLAILWAASWICCASPATHSGGTAPTANGKTVDDDSSSDDDDDQSGNPPQFNRELFDDVAEQIGFLPYLRIKPVDSGPGFAGYTRYAFSTDDVKCYYGGTADVEVSVGSSDDVIFYMEGGGASWPGQELAINMDMPGLGGILERVAANPLRDWNIVYVPYCDNSIHAGDADVYENGVNIHHHGLRHTAAAAALAAKLFPNARRVLVTGMSAGAFGTYEGWPIVKSVFPNAKTYVYSESGVGFFNPNKLDQWNEILSCWNLHVPKECQRCNGPILTYLYELWMEIDPQVKIGLFSSWHDFIIADWFLQMGPNPFANLLAETAEKIKTDYPDRFSRFFIQGISHTAMMTIGGLNHAVDGVSVYEWVGQMAYDDSEWADHVQPIE